jgi:plastocyanin
MRMPLKLQHRSLRIATVVGAVAVLAFGAIGGTAAQSNATVSIANFAFSPATINVSVGDTVVFVNNDSVAHTATATDGSFDTGTIQPGGSASVTFTSAGTFSYMCSIHPNMTGTVIVNASDDGSGTDPGGNDGGGTTELPDTGSGPLSGGSGPTAAAILLVLMAAGLVVVSRLIRPAKPGPRY